MRLPRFLGRKRRTSRSQPRPRLEFLETRRILATVDWTGGGGDTSWSNPANWSSAPNLPGPNDDVVISAPAGVTITHASGSDSIRSLLSENAFILSGGTLSAPSGGTLARATVQPGSGGLSRSF
ncbi:MAG TPA: hypothetical protein VND64_06915 [Pirellulales bacterium]|nr:hypothetical protein [Pirellulales bacterium]